MDRELAPWNLTHNRYMLLAAAEHLEEDDAFTQRALAQATQLDESTISTAVRALESHGLLDRGIDGLDCRMWRIRVTTNGRRLLARARPVVESLAAGFASTEARPVRRPTRP